MKFLVSVGCSEYDDCPGFVFPEEFSIMRKLGIAF